MRTCRQRKVRRLALATGIVVSTVLFASTSSSFAGERDLGRDVLDRGTELLSEGEPLRARKTLLQLDRTTLAPAERVRLVTLLRQISREVELADPLDLSIEKARIAISDGDLRLAERHAIAVYDNGEASGRQHSAAADVLSAINEARTSLRPQVNDLLDQGVEMLRGGDLASAKMHFTLLYDSGVELTEPQQVILFEHLAHLLDLEEQAGGTLRDARVMAAMLQPGSVVRRGTQDEPDEPVEEPVEEPAEEPVEEEPAADDEQPIEAEPEPVEQPLPDDFLQEMFRIEATAFLSAGDRAFEEQRWSDAIRAYRTALDSYGSYLTEEELTQATDRLSRCRTFLEKEEILPTIVRDRDVAEQQIISDFERRMEEAEDALAGGDTQRALRQVGRAQTSWLAGEDYLSEAAYEAGLRRADNLRERIIAQIKEEQEEETRIKVVEQIAGQRTLESQAALERQQKINQALDRVKALQAEQKYDEALQVIEEIRFSDPGNATADILHRVISDIVMYRRYWQIQRDKPRSYAEEFLQIENSLIVPQPVLDYPDDWPELSTIRGIRAAYMEPREDREVAQILASQRLPFEFDDIAIEQVFQYIENLVPGVNVNVDWSSLDEANIEKDTTVSLSLMNVTVKVGLERVLEQLNTGLDDLDRVWYSIRDGIVNISLDEELRKYTIPIVYDIRDLLIDIPDHEDAPDLNLQSALQQGKGGGGGNIFGGQGGDTVETPTEEELTDQLVDLVQQTIDYEGWRDNGGETGTIIPLRGNLIITNTPANHIQIEGLLSQLREIRSMQVNIEARFLSVAQDWFEQIGFNLDVVFNAQNNQFRSLASQNPGLLPSDMFTPQGMLVRNLAGPDSNLLVANQGAGTGGVGTIILPDGREIYTNLQAPQTITLDGPLMPVPRPDQLSMVSGLQNSLGLTEMLGAAGFAGEILAKGPALAVGATFLDDIQVDLLIKATQADRRTVTLTAPRLTVFNGQRSYIQVAVTEAFISDLQPVTGDNSVGFDPTTATVSSGVVLDVEATVSADRRYVTIHVDAQLAEVRGFRTVPVTATAGGGQLVTSDPSLAGTLAAPQQLAGGFIELPEMQVSRVVTSVSVPDKGTVLLGGQRLVSDLEVETGVPILSKIPVINRFFTNRISSKEESTLLILLRPQIIIQHEEEERNFPGLRDDLRTRYGASRF
ncbi:MAG: hypothetical protein KAS72_06590 [Phycisphaerales bacterium]|nr:hypothetical protein [Phycisphaerales bacterium]